MCCILRSSRECVCMCPQYRCVILRAHELRCVRRCKVFHGVQLVNFFRFSFRWGAIWCERSVLRSLLIRAVCRGRAYRSLGGRRPPGRWGWRQWPCDWLLTRSPPPVKRHVPWDAQLVCRFSMTRTNPDRDRHVWGGGTWAREKPANASRFFHSRSLGRNACFCPPLSTHKQFNPFFNQTVSCNGRCLTRASYFIRWAQETGLESLLEPLLPLIS